ncbi:uncharacterized protein K02A2.6-like [Tachysurus ichikawai]
MEIDTGAAVSLLSDAVYSKIFINLPLKPPNVVLKTYTGESVTMKGHTHTYDIKYRKSELHGNADGLSRLPLADKVKEAKVAKIFYFSQVERAPIMVRAPISTQGHTK